MQLKASCFEERDSFDQWLCLLAGPVGVRLMLISGDGEWYDFGQCKQPAVSSIFGDDQEEQLEKVEETSWPFLCKV